MNRYPNHPIKRFILTGTTAKLFRSLFDSYIKDGSTEEQSVLITCAMGTVITTDQLDRIEARLMERNTFLNKTKWNVSRCFETGNDMDAYDEDGVLISLYDDEFAESDEPTDHDEDEWKNGKEILARILHDVGVKPNMLPNGKIGYQSEPDGGERMHALEDRWRFNAKFIVLEEYCWKAPLHEDDPFCILAKHLRDTYSKRHEVENSELYRWNWKDYTLFPLPENLQKKEENNQTSHDQ